MSDHFIWKSGNVVCLDCDC